MIVEWLGDILITVPEQPTLIPLPTGVRLQQLQQQEEKRNYTPWILGGLVLVGGVLVWGWLA